MRAINRHYTHVADELTVDDRGMMLPSRNHVVVLVSKLHKPTMRALAYARATRPDTLTALTVNVDDEETRALLAEWERQDLPVKLTVLESPFREVTTPIVDYVRNLRAKRPNDVVSVFIPEYVVGHWWEHVLHNQSALRLKTRLLFQPGVMVTSVPWQLASSQLRVESETVGTPTSLPRHGRGADIYTDNAAGSATEPARHAEPARPAEPDEPRIPSRS